MLAVCAMFFFAVALFVRLFRASRNVIAQGNEKYLEIRTRRFLRFWGVMR